MYSQDLYRTLVASYYRGSDGLIVVYDITDMDSFEQVPYWLGEAGRYASPDVSRMLIGNKADKEQDRAVDRRVAQSFADRWVTVRSSAASFWTNSSGETLIPAHCQHCHNCFINHRNDHWDLKHTWSFKPHGTRIEENMHKMSINISCSLRWETLHLKHGDDGVHVHWKFTTIWTRYRFRIYVFKYKTSFS